MACKAAKKLIGGILFVQCRGGSSIVALLM